MRFLLFIKKSTNAFFIFFNYRKRMIRRRAFTISAIPILKTQWTTAVQTEKRRKSRMEIKCWGEFFNVYFDWVWFVAFFITYPTIHYWIGMAKMPEQIWSFSLAPFYHTWMGFDSIAFNISFFENKTLIYLDNVIS